MEGFKCKNTLLLQKHEKKFVMDAAKVKDKSYMFRTFSKVDDKYAKITDDVHNLYAAVDKEKNFVTANVNMTNLKNEYTDGWGVD